MCERQKNWKKTGFANPQLNQLFCVRCSIIAITTRQNVPAALRLQFFADIAFYCTSDITSARLVETRRMSRFWFKGRCYHLTSEKRWLLIARRRHPRQKGGPAPPGPPLATTVTETLHIIEIDFSRSSAVSNSCAEQLLTTVATCTCNQTHMYTPANTLVHSSKHTSTRNYTQANPQVWVATYSSLVYTVCFSVIDRNVFAMTKKKTESFRSECLKI